MNRPHRAGARVIAVAMPVEKKRASLAAAMALGAITTVIVYVVAALLS